MLAHLRAVYPLEGCGLLGGRNGRIQHHYPIDNILHSPTAYEMDALQQITAMLEMEERGDDTLVIYHSHPQSPAYPSPTDRELAYYPEAIYLIISLADFANPQLQAFFLRENEERQISCHLE